MREGIRSLGEQNSGWLIAWQIRDQGYLHMCTRYYVDRDLIFSLFGKLTRAYTIHQKSNFVLSSWQFHGDQGRVIQGHSGDQVA